ncbi:hypothetical protein HAX54_029531 [Datura stramonium]|uniref:Uncharacterized protein n=1 Tax=Datura stramonium TaxID=4076 RepID=A0ABS8V650_DATST|nr:hypothetical protein [Datura stramonium]
MLGGFRSLKILCVQEMGATSYRGPLRQRDNHGSKTVSKVGVPLTEKFSDGSTMTYRGSGTYSTAARPWQQSSDHCSEAQSNEQASKHPT